MADTPSFDERLIAAMAEMANPTKSSTATVPTKSGKYTYKYETLDQVLAAVRPPLLSHGIGLTQKQVWDEVTQQYVLQTIVFDAENQRILDQRPILPFADAQACGSWETYMRRYALRTAFGLAGEDDDGKAAKDYAERAPKRPEPPKPDKRAQYLSRCLQLKAQCMAQGVRESGLDEWYVASFGDAEPKSLSLDQLTEWGKYLGQIAKDSEAGDEH